MIPDVVTSVPKSFFPACVAVVGNGPLLFSDRVNISALSSKGCHVIRFNDLKNYNASTEVIHVHVMREMEDTRTYAGSTIESDAVRAIVGMHAGVEDRFNDTNLLLRVPTIGMHGFDVFPNCLSPSLDTVRAWPSTGTIMLIILEARDEVHTIHVFGMNWNFPDSSPHSQTFESKAVRNCCPKCHVLSTPNRHYTM